MALEGGDSGTTTANAIRAGQAFVELILKDETRAALVKAKRGLKDLEGESKKFSERVAEQFRLAVGDRSPLAFTGKVAEIAASKLPQVARAASSVAAAATRAAESADWQSTRYTRLAAAMHEPNAAAQHLWRTLGQLRQQYERSGSVKTWIDQGAWIKRASGLMQEYGYRAASAGAAGKAAGELIATASTIAFGKASGGAQVGGGLAQASGFLGELGLKVGDVGDKLKSMGLVGFLANMLGIRRVIATVIAAFEKGGEIAQRVAGSLRTVAAAVREIGEAARARGFDRVGDLLDGLGGSLDGGAGRVSRFGLGLGQVARSIDLLDKVLHPFRTAWEYAGKVASAAMRTARVGVIGVYDVAKRSAVGRTIVAGYDAAGQAATRFGDVAKAALGKVFKGSVIGRGAGVVFRELFGGDDEASRGARIVRAVLTTAVGQAGAAVMAKAKGIAGAALRGVGGAVGGTAKAIYSGIAGGLSLASAGITKFKGLLKDNAAFRGIDALGGKLRGVGAAALGAGAGLVAGGVSWFSAIDSLNDMADELGNGLLLLSRRTGASVEELSRLKYAGEIAGVPFETLSGTLTEFGSKISEALDGSDEPFRRLHLNAQELANLPVGEQLEKVGEALSKVARADDRNKLATALGLTGIVPLLEEGTAGIRKLKAEADSVGAVFTQEDAEKAREWTKLMASLKAGVQGIALEIGRAMQPSLETINQRFQQLRSGIKIVRELVMPFKEHADTIAYAGLAVAGVGLAIAGVGAVAVPLGAALSGVVGVLSAAGAAVSFLLSPLGLVGAGLAAAGVYAIGFTRTGEELQSFLGGALSDAFESVSTTATEAWGDISAAIKSGDMKGAASIATAAVQLEWEKFKTWFSRLWVDIQAEFDGAMELVNLAWTSFTDSIEATKAAVAQIGKDFTDAGTVISDAWNGLFGTISSANGEIAKNNESTTSQMASDHRTAAQKAADYWKDAQTAIAISITRNLSLLKYTFGVVGLAARAIDLGGADPADIEATLLTQREEERAKDKAAREKQAKDREAERKKDRDEAASRLQKAADALALARAPQLPLGGLLGGAAFALSAKANFKEELEKKGAKPGEKDAIGAVFGGLGIAAEQAKQAKALQQVAQATKGIMASGSTASTIAQALAYGDKVGLRDVTERGAKAAEKGAAAAVAWLPKIAENIENIEPLTYG